MLNNINKTNQKLFTLVATSLLSLTILPACSSNKASTGGLHNQTGEQTNLNNQSQNDSNQVNVDAQESILDICSTASLDDGIYIVISIEGIDDGIYIDLPTEGIDDSIYVDPPSCDRQDILFI